MEEIVTTLRITKKLLSHVASISGCSKSVKCILDSDGNFELTSSGLKYLQSVHSPYWVYDELLERCMCFDTKFGFGSEMYLMFVGFWCELFLKLLEQGIPSNIISYIVLELLDRTSNIVMKENSIKLDKIQDILYMSDLKFNSRNSNSLENGTNPLTFNSPAPIPHKLLFSPHVRAQKPVPKTSLNSAFTSSGLSLNRKLVNFSKYSRHAMSEECESTKKEKFEHMKQCVRRYCTLTCETDENEMVKVVTNLFLYEASYLLQHQKDVNSLKQLYIEQERIIVGSYIGCEKTSGQYGICGISVECTDWYFFDTLMNFHDKSVNIALVNTIAYGDSLPETEDLELNQVIQGIELLNQSVPSVSRLSKLMKDLDVSIVFYRGNLDDINVSEFASNDIAVVNVRDFSILHKLSKMLSSTIVHGLQRVSKANVHSVNVHVLHLSEYKRANKGNRFKYKEKYASKLHFVIQHISESHGELLEIPERVSNREQLFYSVILVGRSKELINLQVESFWDTFNRVQSALKDNSLINTSWLTERKLISCILSYSKSSIVNNDSCTATTYSKVGWIHDNMVYLDVVSKEVIDVLNSFIDHHTFITKNDKIYESSKYRTDLWMDSLLCVISFIDTRCVDICL